MFERPISWFEQRENQTIYRNNRPVIVVNKEAASYLYGLQSKGFRFSETKQEENNVSDKPRVHSAPPSSVCTACES